MFFSVVFPAIILILCVIGAVIFLVMGLKTSKDEQTVQTRVSELSSGNKNRTKLLRHKALENSFNERVLFPLAQKVFDKTQEFIPLSSKSFVKSKLTQAGYTNPTYPKIFFGIQLLCTIFAFGFLVFVTTIIMHSDGITSFIVATFAAAIGYVFPFLWLIQESQKRQEAIQKGLADFLDLLLICVEAGLGLDMAIKKIANMNTDKNKHEEGKKVKKVDYLNEELKHYIKDIGFGMSRRDALQGLADRTGVDDLNALVNALIQSYEMGTGISQTLRVQSETLRDKRIQKAEEKANKVPVKLVLPIYIFLFPAIFLAIAGPIGMILIDTIGNIVKNAQQTS